jgi:hypothetical protein
MLNISLRPALGKLAKTTKNIKETSPKNKLINGISFMI